MFGANLAVKMAPGSRLRQNPRRNPPINSADDELAGAPPGAPTESSGSPAPTSRVSSCALTLSPAPIAALASVVSSTNNELFKKFMKAYISAKRQGKDTDPRKLLLKARFPEMYSGNSHMECYKFCQQCEDHFDKARVTKPNQIPFAALFLRGTISRKVSIIQGPTRFS